MEKNIALQWHRNAEEVDSSLRDLQHHPIRQWFPFRRCILENRVYIFCIRRKKATTYHLQIDAQAVRYNQTITTRQVIM